MMGIIDNIFSIGGKGTNELVQRSTMQSFCVQLIVQIYATQIGFISV